MPFIVNEEDVVDLIYSYLYKLISIPDEAKTLDHIHFIQFLQYILSLYIEEDAS